MNIQEAINHNKLKIAALTASWKGLPMADPKREELRLSVEKETEETGHDLHDLLILQSAGFKSFVEVARLEPAAVKPVVAEPVAVVEVAEEPEAKPTKKGRK